MRLHTPNDLTEQQRRSIQYDVLRSSYVREVTGHRYATLQYPTVYAFAYSLPAQWQIQTERQGVDVLDPDSACRLPCSGHGQSYGVVCPVAPGPGYLCCLHHFIARPIEAASPQQQGAAGFHISTCLGGYEQSKREIRVVDVFESTAGVGASHSTLCIFLLGQAKQDPVQAFIRKPIFF